MAGRDPQFRSAPLAHPIGTSVVIDGWTDSAAYFRRTLTNEQAQDLRDSLEKAMANADTRHD